MDYSKLAKQFGGTMNTTPVAGGAGATDFSKLAGQFGGKSEAPVDTKPYTAPDFKTKSFAGNDGGVAGFGKSVFDFFTNAAQALGQNAGQSIAAGGGDNPLVKALGLGGKNNIDLYSDALGSWSTINNNLQNHIATIKKSGGDTSKLEKVLQDYQQNQPKLEDFVGADTAKRMREDFVTNLEEVAGQGIGTVLEAMSGGIFSGETGLAKGSFQLSKEAPALLDKTIPIGQKILKGYEIGSSFGLASGASSAMSEKKSAIDVGISTGVGGLVGGALGMATEGVVGKIIQNKANKAEQTAIKSLNPELTSAELEKQYKKVLTGGRTVDKAGLFSEQGLTPSERQVQLGQRLKDVLTSTSPIKNLESMAKNMEETEVKLQTALKANPDIPLNKSTLQKDILNLNRKIPKEFATIKDSTNLYESVINFANEIVDKAPDTIPGGREARTLFDSQARNEFPNAFTEAGINTNSPAGRAIKLVRDTMNEHLYNTAPNGSEIQQLIGREADLFNANASIAPRAAKGEGLNKIKLLAKKYPTLSKYLKYGLWVGLSGGVGWEAKTIYGGITGS